MANRHGRQPVAPELVPKHDGYLPAGAVAEAGFAAVLCHPSLSTFSALNPCMPFSTATFRAEDNNGRWIALLNGFEMTLEYILSQIVVSGQDSWTVVGQPA